VPSKRGGGTEAEVRGDGSTSLTEPRRLSAVAQRARPSRAGLAAHEPPAAGCQSRTSLRPGPAFAFSLIQTMNRHHVNTSRVNCIAPDLGKICATFLVILCNMSSGYQYESHCKLLSLKEITSEVYKDVYVIQAIPCVNTCIANRDNANSVFLKPLQDRTDILYIPIC